MVGCRPRSHVHKKINRLLVYFTITNQDLKPPRLFENHVLCTHHEELQWKARTSSRHPQSLNTHGHIHHVSSSLGAGQHGGHTSAGRVVRVHVDGYVWETVSQSADQKPAALWLQQAGHVLDVEMEGNMSVTPG